MKRLDEQIAIEQAALHDLDVQAEQHRRHLAKLEVDRQTIEEVAISLGNDGPSASAIMDAEETEEWRALNRLDAVERVLREHQVPMLLGAIAAALEEHGRHADTTPVISASLAHLKKRRGSVSSQRRGLWYYVPKGEPLMVGRRIRQLHVQPEESRPPANCGAETPVAPDIG
jgi:hypothetical protein